MKRKRQWKGFVLGMVTATLIFCLGTSALAATVRQLEASYSGIKITLDGAEITPKDANGNLVEPFTVSGTTYLPVRAIADALGIGVAWDGATQTVILTRNGSVPSPAPAQTPTQNLAPQQAKQGQSYKITYQNCALSDSIIGGTSYNAIVEIENDGTENLYLKDAAFDFEDKTGHLLETKSFVSADPQIIAPGEKGYFYSTGILEKVTTTTEYVFKPTLKVEKSKNSIIRYTISDTEKEDSAYGGITITGRVQNNTQDDDSMIWVAFVLYRSDGTPITAGGTNVMDVKSGQTASFSRRFSPSEIGDDPSVVASYKIFAGKNQYQF